MPDKPVSGKQLAANRRNALKSTGPRTPEGKARSSRNAVKHGLLAKEAVITDGDGAEDPAEFDEHLESLIAHYDPVGPIENYLVQDVAQCLWRKRRALRFEVGAIREQVDVPRRPASDTEHTPSGRPEEDLLAEFLTALDEYDDERAAKAWAEQQEDLTTPEAIQRLAPAFRVLAFFHRRPGGPSTAKLDHGRLAAELAEDGLLRDQLLAAMGLVIKIRHKLTEAAVEERAMTSRACKLFRERSTLVGLLPSEKDLNRLIRYETMVDRQLHRALNQLERLQRARKGDQVPAPAVLDVNVSGVREAG